MTDYYTSSDDVQDIHEMSQKIIMAIQDHLGNNFNINLVMSTLFLTTLTGALTARILPDQLKEMLESEIEIYQEMWEYEFGSAEN